MMSLRIGQRASVVVGAFALIVSFQNCSQSSFSSGSGNATGSEESTTGTSTTGSSAHPGSSGSSSGSSTSSSSSSSSPTDDASCANAIANASVLYDANPGNYPASIPNTEALATNDLNLVAGLIGNVSNFSASHVNLNAPTVQNVQAFAADTVQIVAHTVGNVSKFSAFACINAQKIGSLQDLSGGVSIFGRNENGVLAQVGTFQQLSGIVVMHAVNVPLITGASMNATFDSAHIGSVSHASGDIVLINTNIDSVDGFAGTIHLRGSSKILSQDSSAFAVVND